MADKKMGRPTSDPKTQTLKIRISDTDVQKLDFVSEKTGKSKAEIIRQGIQLIFEKNS